MSRTTFGALIVGVVLAGICVGWLLGGPTIIITPLKPTLHTSFEAATSGAQPPPAPTGADTADGWQARKSLRDHLAAALDQVDAAPCNPAARAALFGAFADRALAIADAASQSSDEHGPPFWRTDDDQALDQRLIRLQQQGYVTLDELGRFVMARRLGPGADPAGHFPAPAPDKCGPPPNAVAQN